MNLRHARGFVRLRGDRLSNCQISAVWHTEMYLGGARIAIDITREGTQAGPSAQKGTSHEGEQAGKKASIVGIITLVRGVLSHAKAAVNSPSRGLKLREGSGVPAPWVPPPSELGGVLEEVERVHREAEAKAEAMHRWNHTAFDKPR